MRTIRFDNPFIVAAALAVIFTFSSLHSVSTQEPEGQDGPERENARQELLDIRSRMDKEKKALSAIMKKQGNLLGKIEALKSQLNRSKKRLALLTREQEIAASESRELETGIKELTKRLDKKREAMKARIRTRYRFGQRSSIRVWIDAKSFADFSRRRKYLDVIFMVDLGRIAEYRELMAEWLNAGERLAAKQASLKSLQAVLEDQRSQINSEKRSMTGLLRAIEEEKSTHEAMLSELKASAVRLSGIIAAFDRKSLPPEDGDTVLEDTGESFSQLRGALCYPSPGRVLSGFGKKVHPRFNTVTMQNGIEIGAGEGAPVRAVFKGVVRFAQWFRGYGNLVIIDHENGYYTVYAHLAGIGAGVGQRVSRGTTIGTVGDTGSLQGTSLYFEIRHHKQPLNPEHWLGSCSL